MTTRQERIVGLWNAAEAYIQQVRQEEAQYGGRSYSGQQKGSHKADINRRLRQLEVN